MSGTSPDAAGAGIYRRDNGKENANDNKEFAAKVLLEHKSPLPATRVVSMHAHVSAVVVPIVKQ